MACGINPSIATIVRYCTITSSTNLASMAATSCWLILFFCTFFFLPSKMTGKPITLQRMNYSSRVASRLVEVVHNWPEWDLRRSIICSLVSFGTWVVVSVSWSSAAKSVRCACGLVIMNSSYLTVRVVSLDKTFDFSNTSYSSWPSLSAACPSLEQSAAEQLLMWILFLVAPLSHQRGSSPRMSEVSPRISSQECRCSLYV